jgi:hypothetical protein
MWPWQQLYCRMSLFSARLRRWYDVHGALRPSVVWVTKSGRVKLADSELGSVLAKGPVADLKDSLQFFQDLTLTLILIMAKKSYFKYLNGQK